MSSFKTNFRLIKIYTADESYQLFETLALKKNRNNDGNYVLILQNITLEKEY
jgi:hypothetical protein